MQSIKIKTMLSTLLLLFAVVPMLIVGAVGFFNMTGFADSTVSQYGRITGSAQAQALEQCIADYENDILVMSKDAKITALAAGGSTESSDAAFVVDYLKSVVGGGDDVIDAAVMDKDGAIVVSCTDIQKKGSFFFGYDDNMKNMTAAQTFISPIYSGNTPYEDEIFFLATPLQDDLGNICGYVAQVNSTSEIKKILAVTKYGSANGYLVVSDGDDTVLNYEGKPSQKISSVSGGMRNVFKAVVKDSENNSYGTDYSEDGYIGRYGYFPGITNTSWRWVGIYPADIATSQIFTPILISLGVMLALGIICIIASQLVTKSVVGPIKAMINDMNEIKDGDHSKHIETNTKNEFRDIADLFNEMLSEVTLSEELHRTISDISDNMLFEWDFHKEMMYVSENFKEKFDINPAEAQLANGRFLDKLMDEEAAEGYKRDINTLLKNRTGHSAQYQMRSKTGALGWYSVRTLCITDRLGEPLRVIGVVTDIDSEKKLELQLSERASYDFLSQLYNRNTFERELQSEIKRNAHTRVCVIFLDVDDFKFINDRYGHSVGDEVIKYVSNCLKRRVEGSGFAGRFGGDEFVLCITDPTQIDNIESLSLDLIDELYMGYHSDLASVSINVRASIGISFSPEHGEDSKKLIAAADEAMYFVKKNGKANYHIYQPEDSQASDLQHTL